ncbi:MAG: hypothetical protein AAF555_05175 [Verrucomicrobiota bacterium]
MTATSAQRLLIGLLTVSVTTSLVWALLESDFLRPAVEPTPVREEVPSIAHLPEIPAPAPPEIVEREEGSSELPADLSWYEVLEIVWSGLQAEGVLESLDQEQFTRLADAFDTMNERGPVLSPPAAPQARPAPPSAAVMKREAASLTDSLEAVDSALDQLIEGSIAFDLPSIMKKGKATRIQLLLDPRKTQEELAAIAQENGLVESERILLSDIMLARLQGNGLSILALSSEQQAVSLAGPTTWQWDVTPQASGKQTLFLSLDALLFVDGERQARTLRTFEREIEVEVAWGEDLLQTLQVHWQWMTGSVLIPLGSLIAGRRLGGRGTA